MTYKGLRTKGCMDIPGGMEGTGKAGYVKSIILANRNLSLQTHTG